MKMDHSQIILASASVNRSNILRNIGLKHLVVPSNFHESEFKKKIANLSPNEFVLLLSEQKAKDVVSSSGENSLVIGCDTVVVDPDDSHKLIGKPKNKDDAFEIITKLSGKEHKVITGCTIIKKPSLKKYQLTTETLVKFRKLSTLEIKYYINSGEWQGKAGGYGIQGLGATLIENINGDFYSVVGLPLFFIWEVIIKELGEKKVYNFLLQSTNI